VQVQCSGHTESHLGPWDEMDYGGAKAANEAGRPMVGISGDRGAIGVGRYQKRIHVVGEWAVWLRLRWYRDSVFEGEGHA